MRAPSRGRARSRTSPSNVVVPARSIQPRCVRTASASARLAGGARRRDRRHDAAARRMQLLVRRPAARSANSSTRSPAKHACVWQSTRPGIAQRPRPSSSSTSPSSVPQVAHAARRPRSRRRGRGRTRPRCTSTSPRAAPRSGAARPAGVASWARSRTSRRRPPPGGLIRVDGGIGASRPCASAAATASG